jgi:hypothetical protein
MQLTRPEKGDRTKVAIEIPLTVKVDSLFSGSFQINTIPSEDKHIKCASPTSSFLTSRPVLKECRRTPDICEEEATSPKSELTEQQVTSPRCPLRTCIGPSIRRFLEVSKILIVLLLLLLAIGLLGVVGVEGGGSGAFFQCEELN